MKFTLFALIFVLAFISVSMYLVSPARAERLFTDAKDAVTHVISDN